MLRMGLLSYCYACRDGDHNGFVTRWELGREQVPGPCHGTRNAWEQTITRQDSYLFLNQNRTKCHPKVTVCHIIST